MGTASGSAPAAATRIGAAPDDNATCEACGEPFHRRTCERLCPDCLAPLARVREDAGLTAAALADQVGCTRGTIAALERDERQPQLELAKKIALLLGLDVLAVFPDLRITKGEAGRELRMTSRDVLELCETDVLRCDGSGHWHRVPYGPVRALAREREELRRDWISLNAAEHEYNLPRWVTRRLIAEGRLQEKVTGAESGRRTRHVLRSELERVRAQLVDEHRHLRCPACKKRLKLGRKAHHACLGTLGARLYWRFDDPEARATVVQGHGERVREALEARPPTKVAGWYWHRFGSPKKAGQLAKAIAEQKGKKVGPEFTAVDAEKVRRILELHDKRHSGRNIARLLGVSRGSVRNVIDNRERVVAHFSLDDLG